MDNITLLIIILSCISGFCYVMIATIVDHVLDEGIVNMLLRLLVLLLLTAMIRTLVDSLAVANLETFRFVDFTGY